MLRNMDAEQVDDEIRMDITAEFGEAVKGWEQIRMELNLQDGDCDLEGVTLREQNECYHNEDDDIPFGYGPIALSFADTDAFDRFKTELKELVSDYQDGGNHDGADELRTFKNRLPATFELEQHLE